MSEVIIDNVKFKNVPDKRYGTKVNDILTQSNIGISADVAEYIQSQDFYALVNGLDIDWNGIEVEDGLMLNTTADLINWIKTKGDGSAEIFEDIADNIQSLTEMSEDMIYVDSNPPVLPTQTEYDYDVHFEVTEDEEPTILVDGSKNVYYRSESDDSRIPESEAFSKDGQGNYIHNPHEEGWYERFETPIPGSEHEVSVSWKIGTIFYTIGNRTIGVKTFTDFKTYYVARKEVHSSDSLLDDIKFTHTVSSAEAVHLSLEKQTISATEQQNLTEDQKGQVQKNIGLEKAVPNGVASLNESGVVPAAQLPDEVKNNFATEADIRALFH